MDYNNNNNNNNNNNDDSSRYSYTFEAGNTFHQLTPTENIPPKKKKRSNKTGLLIVSLCLIFTIMGGGIGGGLVYSLLPQADVVEPAATADALPAVTEPVASTPAVTQTSVLTQTGQEDESGRMTPKEIYQLCNDSVVAISVESTAYNVFGQRVAQASAGSGFIVTEDGYIVTNAHVVDGAGSMSVMLADGTDYPATLIGSDTQTDIAVLKIDAHGLSAATIGDSDSMMVGDVVVAIGNPLGELANTLTSGYVSALDREINIDGTPKNMLQTDAAINPGNSGGPLFNDYGEVIGITTSKYASDQIEGLGFAIPTNDAKPIIEALISNGYVTGRPSIGVTVQSISTSDARQYSLPYGAYVVEVNPGEAAEAAGIKVGDIIVRVGDKEIESNSDLSVAKATYKAGDTVEIEVYRYGTRVSENITLSLTFDETFPEEPVAENPIAPWVQYGDFSYGEGE